jgi:formylglycine-generating enzyme required for sulfatase activity
MVRIAGERSAKIGADPKHVESLIATSGNANIGGETPQHTVKVDDFYLMVTEVTNEQYHEFVLATKAKAPLNWAKDAIDAAQAAYLAEQGRLKQEAAQAGKRLETKVFDRDQWWATHWRTAEWKLPTGTESMPVVQVNHQDALDYARWAGLRLMTEQEYQLAGRGRTTRNYPWGEEWKDGVAHTFERGVDRASPVGSYPDGRTEQGVYDLVGNVWEWTDSPYVPFPGFKPFQVEAAGKRMLTAGSRFDANQRVVVGGSYSERKNAARLTTRVGADRSQTTEALGFRCAASITPGLDRANSVLARDLTISARPVDVTYAPTRAFAIDHWETAEGRAKAEGYQVIKDYSTALFIPVEKIAAAASERAIEGAHAREDKLLHIGLLSLSFASLEPALEPGTYVLAFRPADAAKPAAASAPAEPDAAPAETTAPTFDTKQDHWILLDGEGALAAALPARDGLRYDRVTGTGAFTLKPWVAPEKPPPGVTLVPKDELRLGIQIPGLSTGRGFLFDFRLDIAPGSVGSTWRGLGAAAPVAEASGTAPKRAGKAPAKDAAKGG